MEPKNVLKQLYVGLGIYGLFFMILGLIFIRPAWVYAIALVVGIGAACAVLYNMYDTLDKALYREPEKAKSYVTLRSIIRLACAATLMAIAVSINWAAFVGVTVGLIGVKVTALINPFVRKHIFKEVDEIPEAMEEDIDADEKENEDDIPKFSIVNENGEHS